MVSDKKQNGPSRELAHHEVIIGWSYKCGIRGPHLNKIPVAALKASIRRKPDSIASRFACQIRRWYLPLSNNLDELQ